MQMGAYSIRFCYLFLLKGGWAVLMTPTSETLKPKAKDGVTRVCPTDALAYGLGANSMKVAFNYEQPGYVISAGPPPKYPITVGAGEDAPSETREKYIKLNWEEWNKGGKQYATWHAELTTDLQPRLDTGDAQRANGVYEGAGESSFVVVIPGSDETEETVAKEGEKLRAKYFQDSFLYFGKADAANKQNRSIVLYFGNTNDPPKIPLGYIARYTPSEWTAKKKQLADAGRLPRAYTQVNEGGTEMTYAGDFTDAYSTYVGENQEAQGNTGKTCSEPTTLQKIPKGFARFWD